MGVASSSLPDFLSPGHAKILPIIPASTSLKRKAEFYEQLQELLEALAGCDNLLPPILVSDSTELAEVVKLPVTIHFENTKNPLSIEEALKLGLRQEESVGQIPDYVLYANPEYTQRHSEDFDQLISAVLQTGSETAFFGYEDRGHYWTVNPSGEWTQIDPSLQPREARPSTFRALYGLGTISRASVVRRGALVGKGVTIVPREHFSFRGVSRLTLDVLQASRGN
jgi:hypothetical protein